jgi:hypothetical protein
MVLKKWQIGVVIVALLGVVYGLNAISQAQREKAEALAKEAKKTRQEAEQKALAGKGVRYQGTGKPAFAWPQNTGPEKAPVRIVVFLDGTNHCHEVNVNLLKQVEQTYGKLVRVEWRDMSKLEVKDQADKLHIGCEAGLLINGKVETTVERMGGKTLVDFRGPGGGDKYHNEDLYAAVNLILKSEGLKVPEAAKSRAHPPRVGNWRDRGVEMSFTDGLAVQHCRQTAHSL